MRGSTVSYVFPIYNETGNIDVLHRTVSEVVGTLPYAVELIFVNDGSTDDSLTRLRALEAVDPRVRVLDFARNYGHQIAVTAGLDAATGDAVIIMDSDLQDPPAVSLDLIAKWEEGWDVVYAQRRSRKDTAFKRATAAAFYKGLRYMSDVDIPANTGDFRLLDRRVVDELAKYKERDRFLRGMVSFVGFDQTAVQFDRDERLSGVSGYPLGKMLTFATDGIMGFSTFPLKLISRIGFVAALFSLVGIVYTLVMKFFVPQVVVAGWTFIVLSILLMGGLQLIMLGILGGYVGRIYRQVQQRPLYALRDERPSPSRPAPTPRPVPVDLASPVEIALPVALAQPVDVPATVTPVSAQDPALATAPAPTPARRPLFRSAAWFVAIGATNNAVSYLLFALFVHVGGMNPVVAVTITYALGMVISFIGNRRLTFRHSGRIRATVVKFLVANAVGYGVNVLILHEFVSVLGFPALVVQLFAIAVVACITFFSMRLWVFRERP